MAKFPKAGLIPQPHGGALLPAHQPNGGSSWKAAKKQALAALADMTPRGVERVRELMESVDDRVAMVAVTQLLNRTLGTPSDAPQVIDDQASAIDVSRLSPSQQAELSAALATVRRLAALAQPGRIVDV